MCYMHVDVFVCVHECAYGSPKSTLNAFSVALHLIYLAFVLLNVDVSV